MEQLCNALNPEEEQALIAFLKSIKKEGFEHVDTALLDSLPPSSIERCEDILRLVVERDRGIAKDNGKG